MRHVIIIAFAVIALALAGCNASPTHTLPAEEILAKSRDAMKEVQSYRFRGDISGSDDEGVQESVQTGEWAAPDRFALRFQSVGEDVSHVNELVFVGKQFFTRDSDSNEGDWLERQSLPPDEVTPGSPLRFLEIPEGVELMTLEEGAVDGVPAFQLTYARNQETARPVTEFYAIYLELIIGKEDYRVLRVTREDEFRGSSTGTLVDGSESYEEWINTTRSTMEMFDYDRPVKIEVPGSG